MVFCQEQLRCGQKEVLRQKDLNVQSRTRALEALPQRL